MSRSKSNGSGKARRTPPTVRCERCGASDAIQIELSLPDGTEVHFSSCNRCENRWWNRGGELLDLNSVLKLARRGGG